MMDIFPPTNMRIRRRSKFPQAFTLFELLTVILIVALLAALTFPVMRRLRISTSQSQFRAEVVAALQANVSMLNTYRAPDADNSDPRIAGATYGGTAVIFDKQNALIRFANNNQGARDTTIVDPNDPLSKIENQVYSWSWVGPPARTQTNIPKKAYDILKQVEPVQIRNEIGIIGINRDDGGTPMDPTDDKLYMIPMPFAVCCGADAYGLPVSPAFYTNIGSNSSYIPIPVALPAVIVYTRSDLLNVGMDPDDLNAGPLNGLSDQEKINLILGSQPRHGHGLLVQLSLQNGALVDTP